MGVYLNPGNEEFASILRSPPYVDKSGLIAFMNERLGTPASLVCHTRPRRFGKTYAAQMLPRVLHPRQHKLPTAL